MNLESWTSPNFSGGCGTLFLILVTFVADSQSSSDTKMVERSKLVFCYYLIKVMFSANYS